MTKTLAIAIVLATTAVAQAESLEERKYWKQQTDYINKSLDEVEKRCGAKIELEFVDKPGFRAATEKEKNTTSPWAICDKVVDLVESVCRAGEDEKQSVVAKIKSIKCGYANPWTLDVKGGVLLFNANNTQVNFWDWAKPRLEKQL